MCGGAEKRRQDASATNALCNGVLGCGECGFYCGRYWPTRARRKDLTAAGCLKILHCCGAEKRRQDALRKLRAGRRYDCDPGVTELSRSAAGWLDLEAES